jgi:hypothetical protein
VTDYYYDGVRRLREENSRVCATGSSTSSRDYVWGAGYIDEVVALLSAGEGGAGVPPAYPEGSGGDGGGFADEPATYWFLQDANYNVTALLGPLPDDPETLGVLRQYVYEPYGNPVHVDEYIPDPNLPVIQPIPPTTIGHQGLFFYRLCLDAADSVAAPQLTPDAVGLYYNRNRWYDPVLGRFCQRDMNETAMGLATAQARNGQAVKVMLSAFSASGHFSDGMHLYVYCSANPVTHWDPMGLDDPFAEIDAIIFGMQGQKIAAMEQAFGFWKDWVTQQAKALLMAGIVAVLPGPGIFIVGAWNAIEAGIDRVSFGLQQEAETMKKKRFTEEQIAFALRQAESGVASGPICKASSWSSAAAENPRIMG